MQNFALDNADLDPQETQEWLAALENVLKNHGPQRARFLLQQLLHKGISLGGGEVFPGLNTPYVNTIPPEREAKIPQDDGVAKNLRAILLWNAMMMVVRAGGISPELGGHIATFTSIATLYEVGFNHFFHTESPEHGGDLVYFQGHSSPGIYARAFLEGRLSQKELENYRQEVDPPGISSYPHPWLMPDFWQFPTVSMGLGPQQAIYAARFLKYLHNRGLQDTSKRHVWCFCGDGEMDEVESLGAITVANREQLDNLIFVVNCNLQRLDGPVRGNGKIIQELEALFRGAGWNVLKVIWGRRWDPLLAADQDGLLKKLMAEVVDGEYQVCKARDGAYVRENFFGRYEALKERVAHLSDKDIWLLNRGGLDAQKVYAAYHAAVNNNTGQPSIILAKTVKGFGMGTAGEALNSTHQQKKMTLEQMKNYRDRLNLPISDEAIANKEFYLPKSDSPEIKFLKERRAALGGSFPCRRAKSNVERVVPELSYFESILTGSADREISTTMAFVRILNLLLKDKNLAPYIVPIVPDESRTFGMEGMFRQLGIYSVCGQLYQPVDSDQVIYYHESNTGQILQEGINEGGAFCSWMAAATSYSTNNLPMIPFYIYYSMFGFQRIGDLAYAAGDAQARGFLLGGTAGRTTLAGEGLQHQDGHSPILAGTIPNCISYDLAYAYELAVVIHHGMQRMFVEQQNEFYYLTVYNENYLQPAMPKGVEAGIIRGMYLLRQSQLEFAKSRVVLLGGGTILREVLAAAELLEQDYRVAVEVWSVTSFNELHREAWDCERYNKLHPGQTPRVSYVSQCLSHVKTPVIAATDYIRLYAEQIRAYVPAQYATLGTDGFGRSDTRANLRRFFEVDARFIAFTAIQELAGAGFVTIEEVRDSMKRYQIVIDKPNPMSV